MTILDDALEMKDYTIERRRDFHRHPELAFQEVRTSKIVADTLTELGLAVTTGVGETGVVGILEGAVKSPVLLLRFDMDALPIVEETGAEYASENPGKMHACGHDSHVAVGLSVAKLLADRREALKGTVKFVFQPAEEVGDGAKKMIEAGIMENQKPDYVLAMHVWNDKPVGWYALNPGPIMAGAHIFSVKVTGKGGHGASPHQSVDPVAAIAQIITALQTIVSRNVNPLESAVISVCKVEVGSAFNVIPQEGSFSGTIRTFKPEIFELVKSRFYQIIQNVAASMGCEVEIMMKRVTYPVTNDANLTAILTDVIQEIKPDVVVDSTYQTMGSEDFSFMMQDAPGCFVMVGSANHEKGLDYGHHHPKFDIDETCLPYAVALITQSAIRILSQD